MRYKIKDGGQVLFVIRERPCWNELQVQGAELDNHVDLVQ